jgi:hypothetical protein
MRATVVLIVTFYIIEDASQLFQRFWMVLAGGMGWCSSIYLGVKYDTWVCPIGFRTHQTFLEIVAQFELTVSIDAFFLLLRLKQVCSVARFTLTLC